MILIYQDNKPADMKTSEIVKALSNIATTYPDGIAGRMLVLNTFRW